MWKCACYNCRHTWTASSRPGSCPKCGSSYIDAAEQLTKAQSLYMQASSYDNQKAMKELSKEINKPKKK